MDIPIDHPEFAGRGLALRPAGYFSGPRLLLDGEALPRKLKAHVLRGNSGKEVEVRLGLSHFDPVPSVTIDGKELRLVEPLRWYEYAWMGLPAILVLHGGALGALIGYAAFQASTRVFRSGRGAPAKYAITGFITVGAAVVFLVLAVALELLIRSYLPR
jgi:hypothetical protein